MLGYESTENLVNEVTNIEEQLYVNPEQRKKFERLIEKRSVVRDFEIQLHHKGGKKIWASVATRAVRDKKGKIKYYEGTFEDITEAKLAEERLRNSEQLNRAINDFLDPIRDRRQESAERKGFVDEVIYDGTMAMRVEARQTLLSMKKAMGMTGVWNRISRKAEETKKKRAKSS